MRQQLGDPQFVDYLEIIKQVYTEFKNKPTIQMVGASKALHFIHPNLFVPWDSRIRKNYHHQDSLHSKEHTEGSSECYADFMKTCNTIANVIVSKTSRDELARAHPAYKMIGLFRTVAKMIEECNYCWFIRNERWSPV